MESTEGKPRLRRIKSTTEVEEVHQLEQKNRRKRPDKPIHRPCDSLFSWSSNFNNFEGFVNWAFLLLILGGSRLFLENVIKYGVRINPYEWWNVFIGDSTETYIPPSAVLFIYSNVHILMALVIEKGLASGQLSETQGRTAQLTNLLVLLATPIAILNTWGTDIFSLIGGTNVCFTFCVIFLKLWSFVQVNGWCRAAALPTGPNRKRRLSTTPAASIPNGSSPSSGIDKLESRAKALSTDVTYPNNLYIIDMYYFMFAPTLCYELNFPRSDRIRKRFLLRRVLEFVFGMQIVISLVQQWIIPTVKNSLIPFENMDLMKIQERLLKLAIPNHLIWLIWFYLVFHCWLNILGEVLKFADRDFYSDWWNAPDIDTFWRSWNAPVHRWAVRHMYIPVVKSTNSKFLAALVVFFTSAFFHEYLVSVPLRTFKAWAFLGMMAQLPLSFLCKIVVGKNGDRRRLGNMVVWASLILGQPLCIMMYYHDYVITHFGHQLIDSFSHV
jgi:diacylglycerol O-acyltransferase-1